jgi:phage terminase large subunit GpA-like protein
VLSQRASSEPGRWRTERTRYLKEIKNCLSPSSHVQRVALMKGAQVGGIECRNCWIGYPRVARKVDIQAAIDRLRGPQF